jgi:hypothetical protein
MNKWKAVGEFLKKEGWQSLIDKIHSGDISIHISLQDGKPKHNLHFLFLSQKVTDISAYQSLAEVGLEPNSKNLFFAMVTGNDEFINFYKNSDQFYKSNDMLANPVTQAASSGSLKHMGEFLDLGLPYKDLANRDPLLIYLSKYATQASSEELDTFIRQHNVSINTEHITAAKKGQANEEIIKILQQLKGN